MRPDKKGKHNRPRKEKNVSSEQQTEIEKQELDQTEQSQDSQQDENVGFRRRKLESNWDRYEINQDEAVVASDYKDLLKQANLGASHFQRGIKDDQYDDVADSSLAFMKLDCSELADCLLSIPFYKRLPTDNLSIYSESQIESMTQDATFFSRKYENRSSSSKNNISNTQSSLCRFEKFFNESSKDSEKTIYDSSGKTENTTVNKLPVLNRTTKDVANASSTATSTDTSSILPTVVTPITNKITTPCATLVDEEDELEHLLAMTAFTENILDKPVINKQDSSVVETLSVPSKKDVIFDNDEVVSDTDEWLNSILED